MTFSLLLLKIVRCDSSVNSVHPSNVYFHFHVNRYGQSKVINNDATGKMEARSNIPER